MKILQYAFVVDAHYHTKNHEFLISLSRDTAYTRLKWLISTATYEQKMTHHWLASCHLNFYSCWHLQWTVYTPWIWDWLVLSSQFMLYFFPNIRCAVNGRYVVTRDLKTPLLYNKAFKICRIGFEWKLISGE
jgi:hypothetical protein